MRSVIKKIFKILLAVVVLVALGAAAYFALDAWRTETDARERASSPQGRLPEGVEPVAYDLELRIDPRRTRFTGKVAIRLEVTRPVPREGWTALLDSLEQLSNEEIYVLGSGSWQSHPIRSKELDMRENLFVVICILGLLAACGGTPESTETPPQPTEPAPDTSDAGQVACSEAGPQSPRDIDQAAGTNTATFPTAPPYAEMKLCDIHYHRFAEHKAAAYPMPTGSGDHAGFVCSGQEPMGEPAQKCTDTSLGDTIEVHWVFTTCPSAGAGPGLETCLTGCEAPLLRVEGRVFYLTKGAEGELDFGRFTDVGDIRVPAADGAVQYLGSTTGPKFNPPEVCSPFQVTWNVGATCGALNLDSLDNWCGDNGTGNDFRERGAHGVRTLVEDPALLSKIE